VKLDAIARVIHTNPVATLRTRVHQDLALLLNGVGLIALEAESELVQVRCAAWKLNVVFSIIAASALLGLISIRPVDSTISYDAPRI
jgi:hypothetical protein